MGAAAVLHEVAFRKTEDIVKGWGVGQYVHHTQLQRELVDSGGVEFLVTFSEPTPQRPIPPQVASVLVTIEPDIRTAELGVSYAIEGEQQRHAGTEPLRLAWLDAVVHRKQQMQAQVGLFGKKGELQELRAFVPGQHSGSPGARRLVQGEAQVEVHGTAQGLGDARVTISSSQEGDAKVSIHFKAR